MSIKNEFLTGDCAGKKLRRRRRTWKPGRRIRTVSMGVLLMILSVIILPGIAQADVIDEPINKVQGESFLVFFLIMCAVAVIVFISAAILLHIRQKHNDSGRSMTDE